MEVKIEWCNMVVILFFFKSVYLKVKGGNSIIFICIVNIDIMLIFNVVD